MRKFSAIGYHGTQNSDLIIDFNSPVNDVFLGRGFYLWRDSYDRASKWSNATIVYKAIIECRKDEILNFTSTNWNSELVIMKLYLLHFKSKQIYFGEFLDFLIDNIGVDIKLVMIMDMRNKETKLHIQDPYKHTNRTIFSYGDVQMCLKENSVLLDNIERVDDES